MDEYGDTLPEGAVIDIKVGEGALSKWIFNIVLKSYSKTERKTEKKVRFFSFSTVSLICRSKIGDIFY